MRIGSSFDFHPFKEGRPLILGGITIPYHKGLDGVSDGDALLHSIAESILGALSLGDLGTYFKEENSKGLDSKIILQDTNLMMIQKGYKIVNIDSTIILEEPKLSSYIFKMRENIANILNIDIDCVSIKATTMEKCGVIGKKEGCAAFTTILLDEVNHG